MSPTPRPGHLVGLLIRLLPSEWRESVLGDVHEERERRSAGGCRAGMFWSCLLVVRIAVSLMVSRRTTPTIAGPPVGPRNVMDGMILDVRHAVRGLLGHRSYAAIAMVTLALGIGANASVFNLANWLLIRPVPGVTAYHELVTVGFGTPTGARGPVSVVDIQQLARGMPALDDLAGYQTIPLHVARDGGDPRRTDAEIVTGNFFQVLGRPVFMGRGFSPEEGQDPGLPATVVISHRLWLRTFGGRPDVLGQPLIINSHRFAVVGVTVRGFHGASHTGSAELWVPVAQHTRAMPGYRNDLLSTRAARVLFGLVGRLAEGETIAMAGDQAEAVRQAIAAEHPQDSRMNTWRFDVRAGTESRPWVSERVTQAMALLLGIVGLVLVLTCANVANLMLARAFGRRHEIATRLSLGSSRWRVARLLMAESLVLSVAAGLVALGLAWWVSFALEGTVILQGLPPLERAQLDWRVFAFALALAALVSLVAGVLPAVAGSRVQLSAATREGGRGQTAGRRRLRLLLTAAQVVVSVVLLVGALLLARSMLARLSIDPGFDPSRVLAFSVEPGLQDYGPRQEAFYRDLLERVRRVSGVSQAGLAWLQPYSQGAADTTFWLAGESEDARVSAAANMVSPGYFGALGLPLIEGRDFTDVEFQRRESAGNGVVIFTESLARRVFGDSSAVGRRITMAYPVGVTRTVVGVVKDTRQRRLTEELGAVFEPFGQAFPSPWATVVVGLAASAEVVTPALAPLVGDLDPTLPIYNVVRLDDAVRQTMADDLLVVRLTLIFAGLATSLAAVGLYGVLARTYDERRREIGIRAALGAGPAKLARLITSEAARALAIGVVVGVPLSWWLGRYLESRLFGVTRLDAISVLLAVATITIVLTVSSLSPARQAARCDTGEVLRT